MSVAIPPIEVKPERSRERKAEPNNSNRHQEIIVLNVGGKRFSTSRQTLTWVPDSFFTSLLSGRIPSLKDENGAIFIDRDPESFGPILNFMRTRNVDLRNTDLKTLKHEAEFFGIVPLVKRLAVCDELNKSNCGSLLFYCQIKPPVFENLSTSYGGVGQQELLLSQPTFQPTPTTIKYDHSRSVLELTGHGNCIAVAYNHCICVLGVRESRGWEMIFTTPTLDKAPQRVSLNTRSAGGTSGPILAAVVGYEIKVWACSAASSEIVASFDMKLQVDGLFFIGKQLVAINNTGKVVVWQSVQKHWQKQEVEPICSCDTAASFLLLGCTNGSIYYIDMEKFPVRMKDNDLLVTQLFEDPCKDPITALSVYITPNVFPGDTQNWMEVAYGTRAGKVRVVVRHPENIGQAPQIFQSYSVHTCPIMRVVLGERHLISVCAENHVRTWTVTRFRGRISTQPGSTPIASFKVLSLEGAHSLFYPVNSIGPFGERDVEQVFIQRVIPDTDCIFVRSSSTGNRVCKIVSVDGSNISAYYVHECEAVNRTGLRSRRFIFTGHLNGSIQVWDLTSALELSHKNQDVAEGGPSKCELLELLQNCDVVAAASRVSSTFSSRAPSPSPSLMSIMYPGIKPPNGRGSIPASPLSTPSLCVGRSKIPANVTGHTLGNVFQPIEVPHSNSTSSFSDTIVSKENPNGGSCGDDGGSGGDSSGDKRETEITKNELGSLDEDREKMDSIQKETTTKRKYKSASTDLEEEEKNADLDGSVHQRSRSNEIDYFSLRYDSELSKVSAFRSPPGSVHIFRPQTTDQQDNTLLGKSGGTDAAGVTISSVDNKQRSSFSLALDEPVMKDKEEKSLNVEGETSGWLKEFSSSLWSNYFTDDPHNTNC